MDSKPCEVDLSQICDQDRTFRIATRSCHEDLTASIERVGLIQRPILLERHNNHIVVCGFARIEACRRLGWTRIPANCISEQTPQSRCALVAVADNALQRSLNIVEQSRACTLLRRFFKDPSEFISAARSVGLVLTTGLVEKLLAVDRMGPKLQSALIDGAIALPTALKLSTNPDPKSVDSLLALLCELRLSLNRQKELLEWIESIQARERIPIADLLSEAPLVQWRSDASVELPRKSLLIRQYLKKRRYPTIARFEERYHQLELKLNLSSGIELSPPPQFEGRTFSIKIDFNTPSELLQRVADIARLSQSAELMDLLDQKFINSGRQKPPGN